MPNRVAWRPQAATGNVFAFFLPLASPLLTALGRTAASTKRRDGQQESPEETQQRLRELEAILSISAALRVARNADEMVPIVLDETLEVVEAQDGAVVLLDTSRMAYTVRLGRGSLQPLHGRAFFRDTFPWDGDMSIGKPYVTADLGGDLRSALLDCGDSGGPGVLIPLKSATESLGFLIVGRHDGPSFSPGEVGILAAISEMASNALHRERLHKELEDSYLGTVLVLANAVDAKDTYTGGHSGRLAEMALRVADHLGINDGFSEDLRWGAILHDIGKIGIPDSILRKPLPLSDEEWAIIRQHPVIGAQILAPVPKLAGAGIIVRHHHEWWNGQGYPDQLKREAIPLGARILAVVDAYSAITDQRTYKWAASHAQALDELRRCAGTQFDPQIVEAFLQVFAEPLTA